MAIVFLKTAIEPGTVGNRALKCIRNKELGDSTSKAPLTCDEVKIEEDDKG